MTEVKPFKLSTGNHTRNKEELQAERENRRDPDVWEPSPAKSAGHASESEAGDRGRSALIAFGLSADRAGSVVMEAAVRYASPPLHGVLVDLCLDPAARGLRVWVEDGVANFVVQALLRTAPDGARLRAGDERHGSAGAARKLSRLGLAREP